MNIFNKLYYPADRKKAVARRKITKITLEFADFAPETPSVGLNFADSMLNFADSMPNIGEIMLVTTDFMPVTTDFMPDIPSAALNFANIMPDIGVCELILSILEQNYYRFLPETRRA